MDTILGYEQSFSPRQVGELVWLLSQQNILEFLAQVPTERKHRIWFEDLVRRPGPLLQETSHFLGIEFQAQMLQPYEEKQRRMTDGHHPLSRGLVDVKFHKHKQIDAEAADAWKTDYKEDFLSEMTWEVAEALGYQRVERTGKEMAWTRSAPETIRPLTRRDESKELPNRLYELLEAEVDSLPERRGRQGRAG
jgi:hypothetical protein